MAHKIIDDFFDELLKAIGDHLKPYGFKQRTKVFRLVRQNNCGVLELQRSSESSRERILFTVNLGVVCGELLDSIDAGVEKARIVDAHVRQRIGMLLPERPDKWWEITESTSLESLKLELLEAILHKAVPYINQYINTNDIITLWESELSPGLTNTQRVRFLAKLKAKRQGSTA